MYFHYLAKRHHFDDWHSTAPFECRPYKAEVVKLANSVSAASVLEIGCGLGEIISRVNAERRIGIDINQAVVYAARNLYGNLCTFEVSSLTDIETLRVQCGAHVDLLIMVNWPHLLPWHELSTQIKSIIECMQIKHIVIDGISDVALDYAHHHGSQNFGQIGEIVKSVPASDGVRTLYLLDVRQPDQLLGTKS
jgi:SAM-dependent methyltransferase